MIAEVIAIGDELTSGQRLDTNSQWISQRLGELGVPVGFHTTVADDLAACTAVFRAAFERADVVVASGGLGPTADDLTRQAIAEATGRKLARDDDVLETIRAMFARHGRTMPKSNELQAMFPAGSRPIPNAHGTAPGIALEIARAEREPCRLFAMPGVPAELFGMWHATVAPAIAAAMPEARLIRHRRIKCFGAGESKIEAMLPDLVRRGRTPSVGITASGATITLRITAEGASEEECYAAMEPTVATIHESLGTLVFGSEDDELEHVVTRLLAERGATLAVVEWGTGGQIAHWLGDVPDGGDVFRGGLIVTDAEAIRRSLDITNPTSDDQTDGAAVEAMASAARERLAADYGMAVGPMPQTAPGAEPAGRFFVALATPEGVTSRALSCAGHPAIVKVRGAKQALNLLRLTLVDKHG